MAVTSFEVDEQTTALLTELQKKFGVRSNAAVIRKALALANVAAKHADFGQHDHHCVERGKARGEGLA